MTTLITLDMGDVLDLSAYPLPDGVEDDVLNRDRLGKSLNVSQPTLSSWIDQGMPVSKQGSNGKEYEFIFSHCYAWRLWRDEREIQKRLNASERDAQRAMLFRNDDEDDPNANALTAKEISENSRAAMDSMLAAQRRGELVRTDRLEGVFQSLMITVRNTMQAAPDWLEEEFGLSPAQVEKTEAYFDGLLKELRRQIADEQLPAGRVVKLRESDDVINDRTA